MPDLEPKLSALHGKNNSCKLVVVSDSNPACSSLDSRRSAFGKRAGRGSLSSSEVRLTVRELFCWFTLFRYLLRLPRGGVEQWLQEIHRSHKVSVLQVLHDFIETDRVLAQHRHQLF